MTVRNLRRFTQLTDLPSNHVLNACQGYFSVITPVARTNMITNPSFETATTNYTAIGGSIARSTTQQAHGAYSLAITPTSATTDGVRYDTVSLTSGTTYAASCKIYGVAGVPYKISFATTGSVDLAAYTFKGTGRWQWVWVYWNETSSTTRRILVTKNGSTSTGVFYIDGVQVESITAGETVSTYIDGDQQGLLPFVTLPLAYQWNGTRHASTSSRSAQTRDGGMVRNFDFYRLLVTGITGLGIATPSHLAAAQPLTDGATYQGTVVPSRDFTIQARFNTSTPIEFDRQRTAFGQAIGLDRAAPRQPIALLYQKYDGTTPVGDAAKIVASPGNGQGGVWQTTIGEQTEITYTMWLPFLRGMDEGASITVADTLSSSSQNTYIRNEAGTWSVLDNGLASSIEAVARAPDGTLYVVGNFTSFGGTAANRIAQYNPYTGTISALGTGLSGTGRTVQIGPSGKVYVGGVFATAGGTTVNNVAQWNPTTSTWAAMGSGATKGVDAQVNALSIDSNENVYVAGIFLNAGGAGANRVAKWTNSTNAWSALGTGLNSDGVAIAVAFDDGVYVGGAFTTANGVSASRIAKWNGTTFEALSTGLSAQPSTDAMRVSPFNGDLYVGGVFTTAGGLTVNNIARWNGFQFTSLSTGTAGGAGVAKLVFGPDGLLYVNGSFTQVGGIVTSDCFAAWNGSSWVLPDIDFNGTADALGMGFTAGGGLLIFAQNQTIGNSSAAHVNTITNSGSALTYPTVHITGSSVATRLHQIRNYSTGQIVSFNLTIAISEEIDITFADTGIEVVSWVRGSLPNAVLAGSSTTLQLVSGSNNVTTFITGTSTPTVTWRWQKRYTDAAGLTYS